MDVMRLTSIAQADAGKRAGSAEKAAVPGIAGFRRPFLLDLKVARHPPIGNSTARCSPSLRVTGVTVPKNQSTYDSAQKVMLRTLYVFWKVRPIDLLQSRRIPRRPAGKWQDPRRL
jgi:hypothetical protein